MKVKALDTTHEEYDEKHLRQLRALYEGGKPWRQIAAESWFPKRPVEMDDVYRERQQLLAYINHAGGVVEMLAALLFAESPQIDGLPDEGNAGAYYQGLLDDCDGRGASWAGWWKELLGDALVARRGYAWVNLPARGEDEVVDSRADEEARGLLDAYLVRIQPEQVRQWADDDRGRLARVMIRDCRREWLGPEEGTRTVWRWRYIDAEVIRTWEWVATEKKERPGPDDTADELPVILHGFGRIPIVRLELVPGLWAMGKLEDPAVSAARAYNEHHWALHQAANELLTVTSKWSDEDINLGHGHYLRLTRDADGSDTAGYVAPQGVAFEYLQQAVRDTREEVYRVVQQMALAADSDATRARMSGESKAQDWHAVEIILAALVDPVLAAMAETLKLVGLARGDTFEPSLSGLDGWQSEDISTWLQAVLVADGLVKSPTYKRTVAKRAAERVLQDEADAETLEAIRKELDEADYDPPPMFAPVPPFGQRTGLQRDRDDGEADDAQE